MRWAGLTWHLPTDAIPLLAALLFTLNGIWMITYLVLILAVTTPAECAPGNPRTTQQKAAMWGLLAFLAANVLTSALLICLGLRGTPLTPSRRRWMPIILYWDIAKYTALVGFLSWALWYVSDTDKGCWTASRKHDLEIVLWCTVSVVVVIFLILILGYDAVATWAPDRRWNFRVKLMAWLMGCYKTLMDAELPTPNDAEGGLGEADMGQAHWGRRGPGRQPTPAEIIGGILARLYGGIDLEKSDIVAGFTLASVMQAQRRRAHAVARLRRSRVSLTPWGAKILQEGIFSCTLLENKEHMCPYNRTAQILEEAERTRTHPADGTDNQSRDLGSSTTLSSTSAAGGTTTRTADGVNDTADGLHNNNDVIINIPLDEEKSLSDWAIKYPDSPFRRWVRAVSDGSGMLLTPPRWIADTIVETQDVSPHDVMEITTGVGGAVDIEVLKDARHWLVYAAAAYGAQTFVADEQHFHNRRYFRTIASSFIIINHASVGIPAVLVLSFHECC